MRLCIECGKEINEARSFCPDCQIHDTERVEREKEEKERTWRLIAIGTFIYPFITLIVYQFFTRRLEVSNFYDIILMINFISWILALYSLKKKSTFFRYLSLFWNIIVIGWYIIWVNSFNGDGFIH